MKTQRSDADQIDAGHNRPYAQVFAEALDGTGTDAEGNRIEDWCFPTVGG